MVVLISILAIIFTLCGGFFALQFKDKLHLILGFSAGAIIGVAFFDLLPESIELGSKAFSTATITSVMALGFVLYMTLDRFVILHSHNEEGPVQHRHRGIAGASSLSLHSFLDGMGIGLAFQVSPAVGAIVATAVLVHDFSDGINTINFILKNGGTRKEALRWLAIDALAPAVGALSTLFFKLPEAMLGIMLALFCGFFLYIGASDLLPESHHAHPARWTTGATIIGIGVLYLAVRFAGI